MSRGMMEEGRWKKEDVRDLIYKGNCKKLNTNFKINSLCLH